MKKRTTNGNSAPSAINRKNISYSRSISLDILRLIAILGIAIFHTFIPWFETATQAYNPANGIVPNPLVGSHFATFCLGMIGFLGAFGNHVFYIISGFFLIPRMVRNSREQHYWRTQYAQTGRRLLVIVLSTIFYVLICAAINQWIGPATVVSFHSFGWLSYGLEFIWLYLIFVAIAPLLAWIFARFPRSFVSISMCLMVLVYALNAFIAFILPTDLNRGFTQWPKLMSAATYLISFAVAGIIGWYWKSLRNPRLMGVVLLSIAGIGGCVTVALLSLCNQGPVIAQLSYKSTSVISFIAAIGAVVIAAASPKKHFKHSWIQSLIIALAQGSLGFYIVQSLLSNWWSYVCAQILSTVAQLSSVPTGRTVNIWLFIVALICGIIISGVYAGVLLVCDCCIRHPLLRSIGLMK